MPSGAAGKQRGGSASPGRELRSGGVRRRQQVKIDGVHVEKVEHEHNAGRLHCRPLGCVGPRRCGCGWLAWLRGSLMRRRRRRRRRSGTRARLLPPVARYEDGVARAQHRGRRPALQPALGADALATTTSTIATNTSTIAASTDGGGRLMGGRVSTRVVRRVRRDARLVGSHGEHAAAARELQTERIVLVAAEEVEGAGGADVQTRALPQPQAAALRRGSSVGSTLRVRIDACST